ncbi:hypothetical protein E3Z27_18715 [Pseudomonas mediterranea]|uniref:hypothetical protein n=1 Tax=Pseudomonas mediterranea TaxID=183795 RepID=UPI001319A77A|nr:hypothetical protein [Pseudomonas mediterranea]QHA83565.1 hypothetical protein E3Z27_18715 [Pseudomonas mediterranea]
MLASIADQLSSIVQPDAEFNPETIYVRGIKDSVADIPVTYSELSAYFRKATGKHIPALLETRVSPVDSNKVMVNKEWLERQIGAAKKRVVLHSDQLDGNYAGDFEEHDQYGSKHRLSEVNIGRSVVPSFDDRLAMQDIQARLAEAQAMIVELRVREKASIDESRSLYNELRAKDKKIQDREAEIEALKAESAVFKTCFDPKSPIHPKGLYEAFQCWKAVTDNGARDPSGPGGRGALSLVLDWLKARGESATGTIKKPGLRAKRLAAVIGWRGKGSGAIRSK